MIRLRVEKIEASRRGKRKVRAWSKRVADLGKGSMRVDHA